MTYVTQNQVWFYSQVSMDLSIMSRLIELKRWEHDFTLYGNLAPEIGKDIADSAC